LTSSCSAAAADVLGSPLVASNPQQTPCANAATGTTGQDVLLPDCAPTPGFSEFAIAGPYSATFAPNPSSNGSITYSASANTGSFHLAYLAGPLGSGIGCSYLTIDGKGSSSYAQANIGPCPSAAQTTGSSSVLGLVVDGTSYNGDQPQTIDIPGVATIAVNQQVLTNGTITQRALDIKLAATNQDIAVAQSSAGATCS
jgi:hypothetical protein